MATKRRKRGKLGEPPKYIPRPPVLVAAFLASLAAVSGHHQEAESYLLDMLTILCDHRVTIGS